MSDEDLHPHDHGERAGGSDRGGGGDAAGARDPDDEERDDPMGPPKEPCECWCLHCRRTFMSDQIWFQRVKGDPSGFRGFWMCPTANCDGAGFTFDIFPTDPDHPANDGWSYSEDDGEEEEGYDDATDEAGALAAEFDGAGGKGAPAEDWDPDETKWKELDEHLGDDPDDDIEGEEWKHGLQPGERPPEPNWMDEAREQDEHERQYDEPDRRPRELDWTGREDRRRPLQPPEGGWEDDIPF